MPQFIQQPADRQGAGTHHSRRIVCHVYAMHSAKELLRVVQEAVDVGAFGRIVFNGDSELSLFEYFL
jgi:hypothetical protein